MKQDISLDDVKQSALELCAGNEFTTTKEVKEALRAENFWALQEDVSDCMQALVQTGDFDYVPSPDGPWNLYYVPEPTQQFVNTLIQYNAPTPKQPAVVTEVQTPSAGDWYVFPYAIHPDHPEYFTLYVEGNCSRNEARAYAARTTGVPYPEIGCSLV